MANITVNQLASRIGLNVDNLLVKLKEAGLPQTSADAVITDEQKDKLLAHMRPKQEAAKKITLSLKKTSDVRERPQTIEIRKKRSFVMPSADEIQKMTQEEERQRREENQRQLEQQARLEAEREANLTLEAERQIKNPLKVEKNLQPHEAAVVEVKPTIESIKEEVRPVAKEREKNREDSIKKEIDEVKAKKVVKVKPEDRGVHHFSIAAIEPDDDDEKGRDRYAVRHKKKKSFHQNQGSKTTETIVRKVEVPESIIVSELAQKMAVKGVEVIKALMKIGVMATINQIIDQDTAILIIEELGHQAIVLNENAVEDALMNQIVAGEQHVRPPVVTIMGHVDHGKTSLLDYIRRTKVAAGEAGGITQHIGAYHVETPKGMITFLDTPGHAAFTAMRARGANCTDIVILVIAADDGIMPQTIEAIQHAKAAKAPIVVAMTKVDKSDADIEKLKQSMTTYEIIPEEWGGENMFVGVSSKTGQGIDELLDAILLQAEVLELTSVVDASARGVVLESRLDKGRGVVASILVQSGTLKKGDILLAGTEFGRVRALFDEVGKSIDIAGPSIPVEVLGLSGMPKAGDATIVVENEKKAREVALFRQGKFRNVRLHRETASLDNLFDRLKEGEQKVLNIVLKADVQGSLEALVESLNKLSTANVKVNVISSGIGGITESDITLAMASNAVMFGFNVRAEQAAKQLAEREAVDLRYYSIIYNLLDDVKQAMMGMLSPEFKEQIIGIAQVREVFKSSKFGTISGCMVIDGLIKRSNPIRVLRNNVVIFEGELESLRRFKEDASEVRQGMECGIGVKNYQDVKTGDQIEVYERIQIERTL